MLQPCATRAVPDPRCVGVAPCGHPMECWSRLLLIEDFHIMMLCLVILQKV